MTSTGTGVLLFLIVLACFAGQIWSAFGTRGPEYGVGVYDGGAPRQNAAWPD